MQINPHNHLRHTLMTGSENTYGHEKCQLLRLIFPMPISVMPGCCCPNAFSCVLHGWCACTLSIYIHCVLCCKSSVLSNKCSVQAVSCFFVCSVFRWVFRIILDYCCVVKIRWVGCSKLASKMRPFFGCFKLPETRCKKNTSTKRKY